jgi:pyruvate,water dikinase
MLHFFNTKKEPILTEVGGKAKSLIDTTKAGFEVPDGFVLTVAFFEEWLDDLMNRKEWKDFLVSQDQKNCDVIKTIGSGLEFSESQNQALEKALYEHTENSFFAVRSSSPEEDLEDKSFAGQYETILGVAKNDLQNAIKKAFVSVFDFRVIEYKKVNNMPIDNPKIAVIVQRQINSDVSGIGFSINPNNNAYDEVMINASFGLGETIVSGQVTPDTYIYDKVKSVIVDQKIADKKVSLWLKEDGGVFEKNNENAKNKVLTDEEIYRVANLIIACEKHYGRPMDIEWAIENSKLYLLQARPITTYINFPKEMLTEPGERKNLYLDITVLTQGFSEPFSVMGLDIWTRMIEKSRRGTMPEGKDGIIFNVHGKQYMHMSNYTKGLGVRATNQVIGTYEVPVREIFKTIDFKNEYTPLKASKKVKALKKNSIKFLFKLISGLPKGVLNPEKTTEEYREFSEQSFNYLKTSYIKDIPFGELVEDGIDTFGEIAYKIYGMLPGFSALPRLKKMFKGKGVDDLVMALGMDLPTNPTSKMGHQMFELASFHEIQSTNTKEEFIKKLNSKTYSKEFLDLYEDYIYRYGGRGFKEIDIATPRNYNNPGDVFMQLKAINIENNNMNNVKERKEKAYNQLLELAKQMGKEKKFVKLSKSYNDMFGYRENPKYLYVVMVSELRKKAIEVGEKFVKSGRLEHREQIFNLTVEEVTLGEKDENLNLLNLVKKNIEPRKAMESIKEWPKVVDSRGKIFRYIREGQEGDLIGDPIAPGVVQGKAKVLNSPYEKMIEPGEILVTRATEPAWTPVFVNASAVVLEIGGPLQHGAIISREYGIPCVSGLEGATKLIKDGDLIEVDGSSGIVRMIQEKSE